jgi:hypothetical protein
MMHSEALEGRETRLVAVTKRLIFMAATVNVAKGESNG